MPESIEWCTWAQCPCARGMGGFGCVFFLQHASIVAQQADITRERNIMITKKMSGWNQNRREDSDILKKITSSGIS